MKITIKELRSTRQVLRQGCKAEGEAMTRLTDAELAAMEARAGKDAVLFPWADMPRLLAELKAERERCTGLLSAAIELVNGTDDHYIHEILDPAIAKTKESLDT